MRLYVKEMVSFLSQKMKSDKYSHILYIRPHIYLHNNPSGNIRIQLCSEDGELIKESSSIDFSEITSSPEYHGYIRFEVNYLLKKNTFYTIKIVTNGYTFNESSYCGIVNDVGFNKYLYSNIVSRHFNAPLDIEIFSKS
jgi:hypothetical protein